MSARIIYLDTVNGRLVTPANTSAASSWRDFVQDDDEALQLFPVKPNSSQATPYLPDDWSTCAVTVALCGGTGKPTGTTGGPTPIALTEALVWNTDHVAGDIGLSSTTLDAFLGAQDRKTTTLEIKVVDGAGRVKRYQFDNVGVRAAVQESPSTGPTEDPTAYSKAESLALFDLLHGDGYFTARGSDGNAYLYFADDGKWRALVGKIIDGNPTLGFGPALDEVP